MSPSYSIYSLNHCWLWLLFIFPGNHCLCQGAAVWLAAPKAFGKGGQREAPLRGHNTRLGLPCTWLNVLPITPHPLWSGSWGEGTDFFLKPQIITGFKEPFCSSGHAAHVTPTTRERNWLHFKGKYYLLLWNSFRLSKGTFFQKQVSVTKLDHPQLRLLTQTLPVPIPGISDFSQGSLSLLFAFLTPSLFSTCFSPNPALSPFLVSSPPFFTVISIFFEMFWHLMLALFFLLHLLLLSF